MMDFKVDGFQEGLELQSIQILISFRLAWQ